MIRAPVFSDIPKSAYSVGTASYITSMQLGIDMVFFKVVCWMGYWFFKIVYSILNHIANLELMGFFILPYQGSVLHVRGHMNCMLEQDGDFFIPLYKTGFPNGII